MKTLELKRSEAIGYLENRLHFWGLIQKTGKLPNGRTRLSRKDKKWLENAGQPTGEDLIALATKKIKATEKCLAQTKRALGRD